MGTLRIIARDHTGATVNVGHVTICDEAGRWLGSLRLTRAERGGIALTAGAYSLTLEGGAPLTFRTFTVEPARDTLVELEVGAVARHPVTLAHPDDGGDIELDWTWRRGDAPAGRYATRWVRAPGDESTTWAWLAPGDYEVEVVSARGLRARAIVRSACPEAPSPIHLEFR